MDVRADGSIYRDGRRLRTFIHESGYEMITISNRGRKERYRVHRLVAAKHLGIQRDKAVDHIDGDKTNNRVENLRYCTLQENLNKYWEDGNYHGRIKLNREIAEQMRQEYRSGRKTIKVMAKELAVSYDYACKVVRGEYWV